MRAHESSLTGPEQSVEEVWGPLANEPLRVRPPYGVRDPDRVHVLGVETTEQWRARMHLDNLLAVHEPLVGLELSKHDRQILDWLAGWDIPTVGSIACLLHRARAASPAPVHLAAGAR